MDAKIEEGAQIEKIRREMSRIERYFLIQDKLFYFI
jgi:hypothetical protein